ncbi:MAG: calcium-binding protein, partial [Planctomycetota bacterium]|nr:calcium-binding protein [Planctomycetota bacterium]
MQNPGQPAEEWTLPDGTSRFAITHLVSNFFVDETTQVDFATVYNDASTTNDSGALTASLLSGLNMGAAGMAYSNLEGLDIFLGSGDDTFGVTGTMTRGDGYQTVTMLSTGAGADNVTVALAAGTDGFFSVNGEAGDDTIDAIASTLPLVIFGGDGADTLTGGSGDDILFGDRGRVDYRDGTGKLITRLGLGLAERTVLQPGQTESSLADVPFQQTDGVVRGPDVATTRDAATGGGDTLLGGDGDDLIFGGAGGDFIGTDSGGAPAGTENGADAIVGDNGFAWFDSAGAGILSRVATTDPALGGDDTVFGGADADVVLGNAGGDTLSGGDGADFILGDNGQADYDALGRLTTVQTTNPSDGGADTVYGGAGVDTILGGAGGDTLNGDAGNDVILGDNG